MGDSRSVPQITRDKGFLSVEQIRLIQRIRQNAFVRSKSEVIVANTSADLGIEYEYEKPLAFQGVTTYPDFTIEDEESGLYFYWERCGMLHVPQYRRRWEAKKKWYRMHGIIPVGEGGGHHGVLIETRDGPDGSIDCAQIENVIREAILRE